MTHICVSKLIIISSDNGLSPGRRQAIIWTNDGILLIGPLGQNFSEILIEILTFSFKKMRLKKSSAKWWPFCLGLNELIKLKSPLPITYLSIIQSLEILHGTRDTAVLCAKFQNDWTNVTDVMGKRDFARFEFEMSFRRISYTHPCTLYCKRIHVHDKIVTSQKYTVGLLYILAYNIYIQI